MKTKNVVLVVSGLLTAASVFAKPMIPSPLVKNIAGFSTASEPVDFSKLNSVLQLITNQTLVNENQLNFAYPEFDPRLSSVESERLVYSTKATVENTHWHSNAELSVRGNLSVSRDPSQSGILVNYSTTTATDTLALIRYSATQVLQHADSFLRTDPRHAPLLERAANIETMEELTLILKESNAQAIREVNDEIAKSRNKVRCIWAMECGNITVDAWGNRNIDSLGATYAELYIQQLSRMRTSYESNVITFSAEKQEITIATASPQGFLAGGSSMNEGECKTSKVSFTPMRVIVEGSGFGSVTLENLDKMHTDAVKGANDLTANEPRRVKDTQDAFRDALISFKKAINAENIR